MASVMKRLTMMFIIKRMREVENMKKNYLTPEINPVIINTEDIMNGSDTEIDVNPLWDEE